MNALKRARVDREWSQSRLIAAMEAEARRMGAPIAGRSSLKTQLSRWENGHRAPDSLYQRLFQRIYGMSANQLGFQTEGTVGLAVGSTWEQCVTTTAELWSEDMERRTFLQSAAFATAAFTTPVLTALISDPAEGVVRSGANRAVSLSDVAVIRDLTAKLNQLDNKHGGGHVRRLALTVLNEEVAPLLRSGSFTDKVGRELLRAAAEVTQLVGWMSHDVGSHGVAQRYLIQALGLARSAGDTALIAELLCAMSQQSTYIRDAQAADLARAARTVAERRGHIALVAESRLMEAHALARAGSPAACASALHQAEVALDKADRNDEPQWISYFDEAYVSAKFGHCFRELGDHNNAIKYAQRSLQMDENYVRGHAFNLTLLAHAQADAGDLSAACATGHQAVDVVADLSSARAVSYLRDFRSALDPAGATAEVKSLDERLIPILAA
jgi:tetratricopeptide (TPR) repeat protein/transcriptional regulator with XRE-family HTH domain